MLFPTIEFAIFFAVVFPAAWLLNNFNTAKKCFLVIVSYIFYAFWRVDFTLILLTSSIFNFALALLLERFRGPTRLAVLWLGISYNLGVLYLFKYHNFIVASVMNLGTSLGWNVHIPLFEVGLPIAISFLTFHALSYIIDVYHQKIPATRSLLDILLYISFFPHLIAGPIVRAKAFLEQTVHRSDPKSIRLGLSVFLIVGGLFKKVILANYLATDFVDSIFRSPAHFSRLDLVLGTYAYAMELYCDFSAYTDIAIGVANLLGYQFPENFNQPYRALTVQDFWRRWHITLSAWLRDYLYTPLGGNRGSDLTTYRNIMLTMVLGGLWHGANVTFVIWGIFHGSALVVERILRITGKRDRRKLPAMILWLITFHFICLSWVFFRSPSVEGAQTYLGTMVFGEATWSTTVTPFVVFLLTIGAATQIIPHHWFNRLVCAYDRAPILVKIALPSAAILLIVTAAPEGVPPFIYFQF
jgi:D-alanyl-lipoteichoic acid acyltransferase DltB (MBOAT superfamily)